jgi:hypothetical protein
MTLNEAFKQLLSDKAACIQLGMKASNYRQLLKRFRDKDPMLTTQTKLMWLEKAGWKYHLDLTPPDPDI